MPSVADLYLDRSESLPNVYLSPYTRRPEACPLRCRKRYNLQMIKGLFLTILLKAAILNCRQSKHVKEDIGAFRADFRHFERARLRPKTA